MHSPLALAFITIVAQRSLAVALQCETTMFEMLISRYLFSSYSGSILSPVSYGYRN